MQKRGGGTRPSIIARQQIRRPRRLRDRDESLRVRTKLRECGKDDVGRIDEVRFEGRCFRVDAALDEREELRSAAQLLDGAVEQRPVTLVQPENLLLRVASRQQFAAAQIGDELELAEAETKRHPLARVVGPKKNEIALSILVARRAGNERHAVTDSPAKFHQLNGVARRSLQQPLDAQRGHGHDPSAIANLRMRLHRRRDHDRLGALHEIAIRRHDVGDGLQRRGRGE